MIYSRFIIAMANQWELFRPHYVAMTLLAATATEPTLDINIIGTLLDEFQLDSQPVAWPRGCDHSDAQSISSLVWRWIVQHVPSPSPRAALPEAQQLCSCIAQISRELLDCGFPVPLLNREDVIGPLIQVVIKAKPTKDGEALLLALMGKYKERASSRSEICRRH